MIGEESELLSSKPLCGLLNVILSREMWMYKRVSITMLLFILQTLIFLVSCNSELDVSSEVITPDESQVLFDTTPVGVSSATPSSTRNSIATSVDNVFPSNTATPASTPTEDVIELSSEGPWVVYQEENGQLYAINSDGTSTNQLNVVADGWLKPYEGSLSNGLLAVMVEGEGALSQSIDIIFIEFPSLEVKRRISLLSYWESVGDFDSGPEGPYGGIMSEPRWSPNGRYLAFVGSIDGPSADLYVYDSTLDQVRRLSSGKNHAEDPLWSSNGHWIVHKEVSHFHGPTVESLWAASIDGKDVKWLFSPETSWDIWILEWVGEDSFISILRNAGGEKTIRYVDISNGTATMLFSQHLFTVPSVDPSTGVVAFSPMLGVLDEDPILNENGIYLVSPFSMNPKVVIEDVLGGRWDNGMGQFITHENCGDDPSSFIVFNSEGRTSCEILKRNEISPGGHWRLEFDAPPFELSSEINVFDLNDNPIGVVPGIKDGEVFWVSNETGFFMIEDHSLYHIELPSLEVFLVDTNVASEGRYLFLAPRNLPKLTFVDN